MTTSPCIDNLHLSPDFEFRLNSPAQMLPADELFSDGKLIPLHLLPSAKRPEIKRSDLCAPRCSSRWKELLGMKKDSQNAASSPTSTKYLKKLFPHRNSKSSSGESSLHIPLLRDSDSESAASISARASLSSSSSSNADSDDLPRISLGSAKTRRPAAALPRGSSVDSPRLNASGKVVFHELERSASSPSAFKPPLKGMERSLSANVMVSPVLNVPVKQIYVFNFGQKKNGFSKAKYKKP